MICECCRTEINDDAARCSVCGYPCLVIVDGDGEDDRRRQRIEYQKMKLAGVGLCINAYCYSVRDDEAVPDGRKELPLCSALELQDDAIVWANADFAELPSGRSFTVELILRNTGHVRSYALTVTPQKSISHGRIGVRLEEGWRVRLAFGDDEEPVFSEYVSLTDVLS